MFLVILLFPDQKTVHPNSFKLRLNGLHRHNLIAILNVFYPGIEPHLYSHGDSLYAGICKTDVFLR
jgi:hypothetical protein